MGSSFEAFIAGYNPKNIPTPDEIERPEMMANIDGDTGNDIWDPRIIATAIPKAVPMIPPPTDKITASKRN